MVWYVRVMMLWMLPRLGKDPHGVREAILEGLAALQQQAVRSAQPKGRLRLSRWDRAFWAFLCRRWPRWRQACTIVRPATVVSWHRQGNRFFWAWKSRKTHGGRPGVPADLRDLVRRLARENPRWGAPRIHGELAKLGIDLSERSVLRLLPKRVPNPAKVQTWRTFLTNHRDAIAAMDFLIVPTWNYGHLHVLVILEHGRRVVRHVAVTAHPTAEWLKAQLREAFPGDDLPRYLLFDRDGLFAPIREYVNRLGITPKLIGYRCPWQNGVLERFNGTLRRELLDHVIVLGEGHLRRMLREFVAHYHQDRTHLGLGKDAPRGRPRVPRPTPTARVVATPRCGGLHHRYDWDSAA